MTAPRCRCPALPPIVTPQLGPVACACCGEPLELTCRGATDGVHPNGMNADPACHQNPEKRGHGAPRKPARYGEKQCALCRQVFQPSGPRSLVCDRCKAQHTTKTPVENGADSGAGDAK